MPKYKNVVPMNITVPPQILAEIKELAKQQSRSVSNMASVMLQKELARMWARDPGKKDDNRS